MPPMAGAALGNARGAITVDTSDLRNIPGIVRGVAQQTTQAFGAIDLAAHRTRTVFLGVNRTIGSLRGELTGLSIGAGLLTGMGLKVASGFQEADIKLSGMTGSIEKAQELTAVLRKQAAAAGLPFQDMLNMATRLLPTLGGNTKELEKWYDIVKRTAVLNAQEGITGAAFSINEAMSSGGTDLVSLVERFNISRVKLKAALAATGGDFRAALDQVLNQMGITTEVADRMGQSFNASFRVMKDATMQLLAEGFTPLMNALTPILQGTAKWIAQLREANPLVAQLGAGLATVAVVGAPTLLLFNQLVEAVTKLKAMGVLGALFNARAASALGGLGAGVVGVGLGIGAANRIGEATGNERMKNAGIEDLWLRIRQLISNIAFTFFEVTRLIRTGMTAALNAFLSTIAAFNSALANVWLKLGAALPAAFGGDAFTNAGNKLNQSADVNRQVIEFLNQRNARMDKENRAGLKSFIEFMVPGTFTSSATAAGGGGGSTIPGSDPNAERNKIIFQWAKDVERIERDAANARLDAVRDYNRSVAQTIAQYNKSALREEEDFQRGRARAIADYNRNIADLQADAAKREATWQRDLNEKITELRADGNERLQELEADYAKNRERAQRDHRDRLMDAAARLDAVGVRNEMRNYKRQQEDAQDAYEEQRAKIREDLTERIADEEKAHQRRLSDAREADAERLDDMRQAFEEQQAQEDYERAIRLQRQAEDHAEQLSEMAIAQAERMQQIEEQAASEKQALNDAFIEQLNQAGTHTEAWLKLQKEQQDAALKQFDLFWQAFRQQFPDGTLVSNRPQAAFPGNQGQFPSSFADFGYGASQVPTSDILRSGGRIAAQGGSSINISEGAIVINASAGMDEDALARAVERRMIKLLQEAAQ